MVETRYRLLETLRQYALERLDESDDLEFWRRRHAQHYADWADLSPPDCSDPTSWSGAPLEAESDDLRAAAAWSLARDAPSDLEVAIRMDRDAPRHRRSAFASSVNGPTSSPTASSRRHRDGVVTCLPRQGSGTRSIRGRRGRRPHARPAAIQAGVQPDANSPGRRAYSVLTIVCGSEGPDGRGTAVRATASAVADLDKPFAIVASARQLQWRLRARRTPQAARALTLRPSPWAADEHRPGAVRGRYGLGTRRSSAYRSRFEGAIAIRQTGADRGQVRTALTGITRARIAAGDIKGALAEASRRHRVLPPRRTRAFGRRPRGRDHRRPRRRR